MIKRYQNSAGVLTRFADALAVGLAWVIAYPIRFQLLQFIPSVDLPEISRYYALLPFVLILWVAGFHVLGVYRYDRVLRRSTEIFTLIRAHLTTLILFTSLTYFITQYKFSRGVILIFGLEVLFATYLFRVIFRKVLRILHKKGVNTVSVIALGEGKALKEVIHQINKYPELGISILEVIGTEDYGRLKEVMDKHQPRSLLVALPRTETARLHDLIASLKDDPIEVTILPDYSDFLALGATVDRFEGIPLIQLNESPLLGWYSWMKRLFDFTLSAIGLLLLSPLLLIVSVMVWFTSRGPIFYTQERMGLDGRTFHMVKFRSMKVDAEAETGAVWTVENDDRRTPMGAFLRSTSIDELPQLWNVLVGRYVACGAKAGAPHLCRQVQTRNPKLHAETQSQSRHYGMGSSQWLARGYFSRKTD